MTDDLQHHAVGCYSAHSGIKGWIRRAENPLYAAEAWATLGARVAGASYPRDELERAWKDVLFNQFHDMLSGTAIEPAYEEARDQLGEAASIAARALNHAIQSPSACAARSTRAEPLGRADRQPIVVLNALAWPVRSLVELEYGGFNAADALADDEGPGRLPADAVVCDGPSGGTAWRSRRRSRRSVSDVRVRRGRAAHGRCGVAALPPTRSRTSSCACASTARRAGSSSWSRGDGRDVVDLADGSRPRAVVVDDTSDTWSHRRVAFRDVVGSSRRARWS